MSNVATDNVRSWREQGLTATVHRACAKCLAPGKYLSDDRIRAEWPACYVPPGDERHDTPVGNRCPHCGALRSPSLVQQLGEIWRRRYG